jgi:hypothetical protein
MLAVLAECAAAAYGFDLAVADRVGPRVGELVSA